jgi:predicted nucleic acid-binding protein
MATIIVDTNIVFSALVNKNAKSATFLLEPNHALEMPKFGFVKV